MWGNDIYVSPTQHALDINEKGREQNQKTDANRAIALGPLTNRGLELRVDTKKALNRINGEKKLKLE